MPIAKIFKSGGSYALRLPKDFVPDASEVSLSKVGDKIIVEPLSSDEWPDDFFDLIHIRSVHFNRPAQPDFRSFDV